MKKNKVLLLGIITVFVAIFSLTLVSGTWAKYTSTVSGTDTAKVAKWAWKVNNKNVVAGESQQALVFDLFNTIKDTEGADETDVKEGLIAPGTSGSFEVKIENASEVTGKYAIEFTVSQTDNTVAIPLEYSVDGGANWSSTLNAISASDATKLAVGGNATVTIQWRWKFEGNDGTDTTDTNLGLKAPSITVTATLTFTQVD